MEPAAAPIRVALLGADAQTPGLVAALAASQSFELVGYCEVEFPDGAAADSAWNLLRRVQAYDVWESLLDGQQIDAVIVARAEQEDRRADQLRKLIQAEVPLLVSHPVVDSMLVYYELDMIQRETGSPLVPYLPERLHPAVQTLAELVSQADGSAIGRVQQVVLERGIAVPTKQRVVRHFARDVDVLRAVAGDLTRLGAMAGGAGEAAYASLGVQLSGPQGIVARWSVAPGDLDGGARLSLLGERGKAVVVLPAAAAQGATVEISASGQTRSLAAQPWNDAVAALEALAAAIAGRATSPDWVDAARSVELAETIDRSLARGRTIDLHFEEYTEQGTFKGTMASLGCGLLVLGMLLLGVVAIGEQAGVPYTKFWPYLLLGAFVFFLLLQGLMLVFRQAAATSPDSPDAPGGKP